MDFLFVKTNVLDTCHELIGWSDKVKEMAGLVLKWLCGHLAVSDLADRILFKQNKRPSEWRIKSRWTFCFKVIVNVYGFGKTNVKYLF